MSQASAKRLTFVEAGQPIEKIVEQLNALEGIATILTYPSVLSILVREKEAGRLNIQPALIKVSGETLTDDLCQKARHAFPSRKPRSAQRCNVSYRPR